ncbi:MAG: hypothetical protein HFE45_05055, partial [Oscillospiraceae bacterium]|nr:hypothetical protein [Oscillospiraceae bacterium]
IQFQPLPVVSQAAEATVGVAATMDAAITAIAARLKRFVGFFMTYSSIYKI